MASIRRELRIDRNAAQVWPLIGDPGRIHEWFPGIVSCTVETTEDGVSRTVTLGTGIPLVEHIITNDPIAHRFQYRIAGGVFKEHLGTVDVIDLGDGSHKAFGPHGECQIVRPSMVDGIPDHPHAGLLPNRVFACGGIEKGSLQHARPHERKNR